MRGLDAAADGPVAVTTSKPATAVTQAVRLLHLGASLEPRGTGRHVDVDSRREAATSIMCGDGPSDRSSGFRVRQARRVLALAAASLAAAGAGAAAPPRSVPEIAASLAAVEQRGRGGPARRPGGGPAPLRARAQACRRACRCPPERPVRVARRGRAHLAWARARRRRVRPQRRRRRGRGEQEVTAGRAQLAAAGRSCSPGQASEAPAPSPLLAPLAGEAFSGEVRARLPRGTSRLELRWQGKPILRVAKPPHRAWVGRLPPARPSVAERSSWRRRTPDGDDEDERRGRLASCRGTGSTSAAPGAGTPASPLARGDCRDLPGIAGIWVRDLRERPDRRLERQRAFPGGVDREARRPRGLARAVRATPGAVAAAARAPGDRRRGHRTSPPIGCSGCWAMGAPPEGRRLSSERSSGWARPTAPIPAATASAPRTSPAERATPRLAADDDGARPGTGVDDAPGGSFGFPPGPGQEPFDGARGARRPRVAARYAAGRRQCRAPPPLAGANRSGGAEARMDRVRPPHRRDRLRARRAGRRRDPHLRHRPDVAPGTAAGQAGRRRCVAWWTHATNAVVVNPAAGTRRPAAARARPTSAGARPRIAAQPPCLLRACPTAPPRAQPEATLP